MRALWTNEAIDCKRPLGFLGSAAKGTGKAIGHVNKAFFYPYVFGAKALREVYGVLRGEKDRSFTDFRQRLWRNDKWHALFWGLLAGLNQATNVSFLGYEQATSGFDKAEGDDGLVVIDNFPEDDLLYPRAGTYVHTHKYKGKPPLFSRGAENKRGSRAREMVINLVEHVRKHGPIKKLDFYGHGLPGGASLDLANEALFQDLKHNDGRQFLPEDLFAPGAHVRFNSCFIGNGREGEIFKAEFEENVLKKDGTLYLSHLQMVANPIEYAAVQLDFPEPPHWLRVLAEPARAPLGLWTAAVVGTGNVEARIPAVPRISVTKFLPSEKRWKPTGLISQLEALREERAYLHDTEHLLPNYVKTELNRILELEDPERPGKKIKDRADWDTSLEKWSWAGTALFPEQEAKQFAKKINELGIDGLQAKPWDIEKRGEKNSHAPGILLYLTYPKGLDQKKKALAAKFAKSGADLTPGTEFRTKLEVQAMAEIEASGKRGDLTGEEVAREKAQVKGRLDSLQTKFEE